jgi:hypothetical protein
VCGKLGVPPGMRGQTGLTVHHDDGKRFVVRADEILTAFLEFEAPLAATANVEETTWQTLEPWASERSSQRQISSTTYFVFSAQIVPVHLVQPMNG